LLMISDLKQKNGHDDKKLELVCFSAKYAFDNLLSKKPRSLILTSGTLSPLVVF